jgi:hypothetical protein
MGIDVRLEDERGGVAAEAGDPDNLLARLLPPLDDSSFACLRFIDPYGDTVFNNLQMNTLIDEIDRVLTKATKAPERELLRKLRALAERCRAEIHMYLKFYGD